MESNPDEEGTDGLNRRANSRSARHPARRRPGLYEIAVNYLDFMDSPWKGLIESAAVGAG